MGSSARPDWPGIREACAILEDEAVLALDKPAGISVLGERHDTDLVRLAGEAGETLYPVHRIDKVTSGVVLFAKSVAVHGGLTRQFNRRTVDKAYLAITRSEGLPEHGTIDLPLGTGRKGRVRVAAPRASIVRDEATGRWSVPEVHVSPGQKAYPSLTIFTRLAEGGGYSVLLVRPITGRRHQIRVHLAWIGHPIEGDPLFEPAPRSRTLLHAWRLAVDASWSDNHRVELEAAPGPDFWAAVGRRWSARQAEALLDAARDIPGGAGAGPGLPSSG